MDRYQYGDNRPGNASVSYTYDTQLKDIEKTRPLRVLSEADWRHWITWGYVVVPNAVPAENVARTVDLLWEFQELDRTDPESWHKPQLRDHAMKELNNSGMVEIYNHQLLWDNRQHQRIYDAFVDIWDTERLWVTIDRANLNFPLRPGFEYKGFIHWDYDPETKPQNVQGVLALADQTDENMGGFQCIPELFRTYDEWKHTQPADRDHFKPDTTGFSLTKVKLEAGDLLIFNSSQPHGIRPNRSKDKIRIAKLNIDENPHTPPKFNIRGIPTLILFKNGTVEAQKVGAVTKSQLAAFLDSNL